jgi:predicted transcriptional regulator
MTLRLSKDLMRSLKLAAINEERPASEIIRDAIRAYLRNAGGARP